MKLTALTIRYIDFKRATGMRFGSEAWVLRAFCRAMGDIDINVVRPDAVLAYIAGDGPVTSFWHHKFKILTGFSTPVRILITVDLPAPRSRAREM